MTKASSAGTWLFGFSVALVAAVVGYYMTEGRSPHPSGGLASAPVVTVTEVVAELQATPSGSAMETRTTPAQATDLAAAPQAPHFASISASVGLAEGAGQGDQVGPTLFQMAPENALHIATVWTGLNSDGTENEANACQILVTISGPEAHPAVRHSECTFRENGFFQRQAVIFEINTAGEYVVVVTDELTGIQGKVSFTAAA